MVADGKKLPPPQRAFPVSGRKLRFDQAHAPLLKPNQKPAGDSPDPRSQA